MKMVVAIIRHEKLQEVQDVLDECGVSGVTVTEVKGCGAQRGYTEKYRGTAVHISLRPRLKVEAVMQSEIVNTVVDKIAVAARAEAWNTLSRCRASAWRPACGRSRLPSSEQDRRV